MCGNTHLSHPSDYDNSGWADCQAMARHLGLQDGWRHQHGHDAKPIYTHKTLENSTLTTASRIDFILAPNHPQALLNAPCPRCHINFNFGHDISYWAGKGQADHTAKIAPSSRRATVGRSPMFKTSSPSVPQMSDQLLILFLFLSAKVSI